MSEGKYDHVPIRFIHTNSEHRNSFIEIDLFLQLALQKHTPTVIATISNRAQNTKVFSTIAESERITVVYWIAAADVHLTQLAVCKLDI